MTGEVVCNRAFIIPTPLAIVRVKIRIWHVLVFMGIATVAALASMRRVRFQLQQKMTPQE